MNALIPPKDDRPAIKTPQELVHIKHRITLRQYKYWILMLRAYREAYESGGRDNPELYHISITDITRWIGYEPVRSELRADFEAIRREPIIYNVLNKDGKNVLRGAGFISEWEISTHWIAFKLPTFLRDCIERLDLKSAIFQALNWSVFNSFAGKYEAILYKLCKDYLGVGRTPYMPLEMFREYMGIKETEYPAFKDLNKFIISGPMKRINESEVADISLEVELKREVRRVVGLWFRVIEKRKTLLDLGNEPAFRFAKVDISLAQQRLYLEAKPSELIELSIQRANEYAEEQEKKGSEVSNLGALYRKAIEEEWGKEYLSKKTREAEKTEAETARKSAEQEQAKAKQQATLAAEFVRMRTTATVKALNFDEKRAYIERYISEAGNDHAKSYLTATGEFKDVLERARFTGWLRQMVAKKEIDPEEFKGWLEAKKGKAETAV